MPSIVGLGRSSTFSNVAAGTTDSALLTAVPGRKIRVNGFHISCGATPSSVTFNSKSGGAGTAASPTYNNSLVADPSGGPYFDTNTGEGLSVTTGAGSTTGIFVVWSVVNP